MPSSIRQMSSHARPTPCPGVSAFQLDDDLVLYDSGSGQAHVLNPTAAYVWSLCDGVRTTRSIAWQVATTYAIAYRQALADVRELVDGLRTAGLLVTSEQAQGPTRDE